MHTRSDRPRLELGDLATHVITGFTGIVVAKVSYLQGCDQVCLQPHGLTDEGDTKKSYYFDEPYVDLVERGKVPMRNLDGSDMNMEAPVVRLAGPDKAPGHRRDHQPPR